ncbi:MSHA biogenesis protein MshF [Shewanella sp. JM162201]|uniref:MSHA biogenesis protein MshF n=1 Tax=Shewanella jiangmenensis TaxID=2837387 RepID=A0ABS5V2R0_9GAMM|nr:MSHA biogenesis protein MshF [Shewanella jiangmenensis]MBT1444107.1 MSHA biogenesis protein MshF [Shewanella jiangmenensis]
MLSQRDADSDLLSVYRRLLAVVVLMLLLAALAYRYFGSLDSLSSHSLALEQTRLVNIVLMARSQWLGEGQGEQIKLDWARMHEQAPPAPVVVRISQNGWPQPAELSDAGCGALWQQLMGYHWDGDVSLDEPQHSCRYSARGGDTISYQLNSGKVTLVTRTN